MICQVFFLWQRTSVQTGCAVTSRMLFLIKSYTVTPVSKPIDFAIAMPTPAFSKDLTSIFNTVLPEEVKYDLACRLIGESLRVASVSLLLYDPKTDQLVCQGNYLGPQGRSHYKTRDQGLPFIIDYLQVFHYLNAGMVDFHEMTFSHFRSSLFCGETRIEFPVSEEIFYRLKEGWTGPAGYGAMYRTYMAASHGFF
jgi:hypothetical protein